MSEPKTTSEVGHWTLINLLRCEKEIQISVVSKILQGFNREQQIQALSMSGVIKSVCVAPKGECRYYSQNESRNKESG